MAAAGAYVIHLSGAARIRLHAAHDAYNGTPYVLVVEGAIPTATPPGGS